MLWSMKTLPQDGLQGYMPAPPEKRLLINLSIHKIGRPSGPDWLLLEEPVGSLLKNEELVPLTDRDDTTEAATRLTRRRAPQEARALRALHELTTVDRARATCKARCMTRQRGL